MGCGRTREQGPFDAGDGLAQVLGLARPVAAHEALAEGSLDEREQQLGGDAGIEGAQALASAPAAEGRRERRHDLATARGARDVPLGRIGRQHQQARERPLLAHVGEGPAQHRRGGRLARRRRRAVEHALGEAASVLAGDGLEQRALAREVVEDGALGDAGCARELRGGGGGVAALGEQAARGSQQALALARRLAPAGGGLPPRAFARALHRGQAAMGASRPGRAHL